MGWSLSPLWSSYLLWGVMLLLVVEAQVDITPLNVIPFSLPEGGEFKVLHFRGAAGYSGLLSIRFNDTCLALKARSGKLPSRSNSVYDVSRSGAFVVASGDQDNAQWYFLVSRKLANDCEFNRTYHLSVFAYGTEILQPGWPSQHIAVRDSACRLYRIEKPGGVLYLQLLRPNGVQLYVNTTHSTTIPKLAMPALVTMPGYVVFSNTTSEPDFTYLVACAQPNMESADALLIASPSSTLTIRPGVAQILPPLPPGGMGVLYFPGQENAGGVVQLLYLCLLPETCGGNSSSHLAIYIRSGSLPGSEDEFKVHQSGQSFVTDNTDGEAWWIRIENTGTSPTSGWQLALNYSKTTVLRHGVWTASECDSSSFGYQLFKLLSPGVGKNGIVRLEVKLGNFSQIYGSLHPSRVLRDFSLLNSSRVLVKANPDLQEGETWYLLLQFPCAGAMLRLSSVSTRSISPGVTFRISFPYFDRGENQMLLRLPSSLNSNGLLFLQWIGNTPGAEFTMVGSYDGWSKGAVHPINVSSSFYVAGEGADSDSGEWKFLLTAQFAPRSPYLLQITPYQTEGLPLKNTTLVSFQPGQTTKLLRLVDMSNDPAQGPAVSWKSDSAGSDFVLRVAQHIPRLGSSASPRAGSQISPLESSSYWVLLSVTNSSTIVRLEASLVDLSAMPANYSSPIDFSDASFLIQKMEFPLGMARLPPIVIRPTISDTSIREDLQVFAQLDSIPDPTTSTPLAFGQWFSPGEVHVQEGSQWYLVLVQSQAPSSKNATANETFSMIMQSTIDLCHPVLACSAHGHCSSGWTYDSSEDLCECLETLSYTYMEPLCLTKDRTSFWWFFLAVAVVFGILPLVLSTVYNHIVRRLRDRRLRHRSGDERAQLANLDVDKLVGLELIDVSTTPSAGFGFANISATFQPGKLYAIMGGSGAGKSTLLNVMLGRLAYKGKIRINGQDEKISKYRKIVGFVPQDDIMLLELSVKENIYYSAALRLPRDTPREQRRKLIKGLLVELGLNKEVRHSQIGFPGSGAHVSGGERKRTSIAMELVASPSVLFLDEPTSGLDSKTTLELVRHLKHIASKGYTVIAVIHQPSPEVFKCFDEVMFLAKEGESGAKKGVVKYFGPPGQAVAQLAAFHEAQEQGEDEKNMLRRRKAKDKEKEKEADLEQGEGADDVEHHRFDADFIMRHLDEFPSTEYPAKDTPRNPPPERYTPLFPVQLWLFFQRAVLQLNYNLRMFYLNNIWVAVAAGLLGYSFRNSVYKGPVEVVDSSQCPLFVQNQCLLPQRDDLAVQYLLTSMAVGLTAIASSLGEFGNERLVYWRESLAGCSETAYFLGKNLANIPAVVVPPLVYCVIYYSLTDAVMPFLDMYWILLGVQFVSIGVGYTISILLPQTLGLVLGVVFVFVAVVLSGFNPRLADIKQDFGDYAEVITWWSFARWSLEALYVAEVNQYKDIYNIDTGLQFRDYAGDSYYKNMGILFGMGIFARLLALIFLKTWNATERGRVPLYRRILLQMQRYSPRLCLPLLGPIEGPHDKVVSKKRTPMKSERLRSWY